MQRNRPFFHESLLLATSLILFLLHPSSVTARIYYVATTGDDNHPGTEAERLRTIQKAASLAGAVETVLVRSGLHKGHVRLGFSGAPDKPIDFKGHGGERPIVDGEGRGRIELQSEHG